MIKDLEFAKSRDIYNFGRPEISIKWSNNITFNQHKQKCKYPWYYVIQISSNKLTPAFRINIFNLIIKPFILNNVHDVHTNYEMYAFNTNRSLNTCTFKLFTCNNKYPATL